MDNGQSLSGPKAVLKWKRGTDPREGKWPGLRVNHLEYVDGMEITRDVPVQMRDGVVVYVDIFKPESNAEPLPIILTWSPYGKHGPKTFAMFPNSGVPDGSVSSHAAWEGPDPLYWTKRGYAVINGDARGSWGSEGDLEIFGQQEALDGYDVIEWAGTLPWSNGRVGTCGVSYLAIVQWRIAELNPPHLCCIMPWEGFSDLYRDYSFHGGIPETSFVKFMEWSCRCSLGSVEDWVEMHRVHKFRDEYFQSKSCQDLARITVPAYVVADWGDQGLHTRGAIEGFNSISSKDKWLEVHGRKKWQYFYQDSSLKRQEEFFQFFLKHQSSAITTVPRVQIEVRERAYEGSMRGESEWPIARTKSVIKHLDASPGLLADEPPCQLSKTSYNSTLDGDCVRFACPFTADTEVTGTMRLRVWVSTDKGDDMDIFVQFDKLDKDGNIVPFVAMAMIDDGPMALGWLRVSHRELDTERSSHARPWLKHQRQLLLRPHEIVPVDIEVWPSSTMFRAGESLRITIQGNDIFKYDLPQVQLHQDSVNKGRHFIYTGEIYDSYLVLPCVS
jgi:predicted acyl esterase